MFITLTRVLPKVLLTEPDNLIECDINLDLVSYIQEYKGETHIRMMDSQDIVVKETRMDIRDIRGAKSIPVKQPPYRSPFPVPLPSPPLGSK